MLIEETKSHNIKHQSFDVAYSLSQQLRYFTCVNLFLDNQAQLDISRYMYCKEFSIPGYPGSYVDQPKRWISKANIIKHALSVMEKNIVNKNKG